MHQSIPTVPIFPPPLPGQPRGIWSRCQSRGWGIRNFIAAQGLGISVPRGDPQAFDTRVLEGWSVRAAKRGRLFLRADTMELRN